MAWSGSATTTAMSLRPSPFETRSRWRGWLIPAALLALTPKCALCLLAYAGLGAALGLGGPELCGGAASVGSSGLPLALGVVLGAAGLALRRRP